MSKMELFFASKEAAIIEIQSWRPSDPKEQKEWDELWGQRTGLLLEAVKQIDMAALPPWPPDRKGYNILHIVIEDHAYPGRGRPITGWYSDRHNIDVGLIFLRTGGDRLAD